MKKKQITKLLNGVMNKFLESITDEEVKKTIIEHGYIAGGCIPSMMMDEYVNDYDLYLSNKDAVDTVLSYYENIENENIENILNEFDCLVDVTPRAKKMFKVKLITDNSINLSDKIQIIIGFYGDASEVINKFDFKHLKSYYVIKDNELIIDPDVYQLLFEKELIYTGSSYPLSSFLRLRKYIKKGWNVSNPEMIKIALDVALSLRSGIRNKNEANEKSNNNVDFFTNIDSVHDETELSVDLLIHHLNGVDPLTIQAELSQRKGVYLTIGEIISLIK